ncbi:MAG: hypothetical protein ACK5AS_04110 [Bacteroidota bacterium]|jgi:hypothetical protein
MKNRIAIALVTLVIALSYGCAKKQSIVGKWLLINVSDKSMDSMMFAMEANIELMSDTISKMSDGANKDTFLIQLEENKTILQNAKNNLAEFTKKSYFDYREDGSYVGNLFGQLETGTYTYDESKGIIEGKAEGSTTSGKMKVERLNADTLVLFIVPQSTLTFLAKKD